jgi:periplasmic divalent cation tolerance protein
MTDAYQIVFNTCPDMEAARDIAEELVMRQLAACVNIIPGVESVYRWQGEIESGNECLLVIKTRATCYSELEQAIKALHPYELPEIVAVPIETALPAYLDWINENTKSE